MGMIGLLYPDSHIAPYLPIGDEKQAQRHIRNPGLAAPIVSGISSPLVIGDPDVAVFDVVASCHSVMCICPPAFPLLEYEIGSSRSLKERLPALRLHPV